MKTVNVVSVSGGKDSTALYLVALQSGKPFIPVFADTGNEHDITYEYVSTLHDKTGGPKVKWVKADFSDNIAHRRNFVANDQRVFIRGRMRLQIYQTASQSISTKLQIGKGRFLTYQSVASQRCFLPTRYPAQVRQGRIL